MPQTVTATNENMEVDSDNNLGEGSSGNLSTNAQASTSNDAKMAIESSGNSVMAGPATVPSVTVSLHPLVIMNISEHWTRIRAQNNSPQQGKLKYKTINRILNDHSNYTYPLFYSCSYWCLDW